MKIYEWSVLSPAEYTQLTSSRLTQRVSVAFTSSFPLLHYLLCSMFADVEVVSPSDFIKENRDSQEPPVPENVLRVLKVVHVLHEPPLAVLEVGHSYYYYYYYYHTTTITLLLSHYYYHTTTITLLLSHYYYHTTTTIAFCNNFKPYNSYFRFNSLKMIYRNWPNLNWNFFLNKNVFYHNNCVIFYLETTTITFFKLMTLIHNQLPPHYNLSLFAVVRQSQERRLRRLSAEGGAEGARTRHSQGQNPARPFQAVRSQAL